MGSSGYHTISNTLLISYMIHKLKRLIDVMNDHSLKEFDPKHALSHRPVQMVRLSVAQGMVGA